MQSHVRNCFILLAVAACGSPSEPAAQSPKAASSPADGAAGFAAQVERGGALYAASCASCHGDAGQGSDSAPAVVGDGVLPLDPPAGAKHRNVQFRTALDVFSWVRKTMPADDPGSLSDADYVAILAFDLKANGVTLDAPLDAEIAKGLVLNE